MEKKKTHTIIISDLHLGSKVSQPKKALEMLGDYEFRKLILLGDIFDSLDFRNLDADCWDFLNYIGKISRNDYKKVRWVIGNHDQGLEQVFGSLIGGKIYDFYAWQYKEEKYLAIHGHQFDRFLINNALISHLATRIYNYIQRVDITDQKRFTRFIKRSSKGWLRMSDKVSRGAMKFAGKKKAEYVFCGHTHKPLKKESQGIKYYNSGCWTDNPCAYITIDEKDINLREY